MRELEQVQAGLGVGGTMPTSWGNHKWAGTGSPVQSLVEVLLQAIQRGGVLPDPVLLRSWPDLEASALRALDLAAPRRVPVVLHCDDPVFLASSRGAMDQMLQIITKWCYRCKARLHASPNKSVITVVCHEDVRAAVDAAPALKLPAQGDDAEQELSRVLGHIWLGILWCPTLDMRAARAAAFSVARQSFSVLAGLVAARAVPLPIALVLFDAKVEGILEHGRWLFAIQEGSDIAYDNLFGDFPREFLGVDHWRNPAVAAAELGWVLSGFGWAVKSMAMCAARLSSRAGDDWYRGFHEHALATGSELSWSHKSACIL